jgi:rubrerythrin
MKLSWNGLVSAAPARKHLQELSQQGVGYKSVADAAGVAESVMYKIRIGERKKIRNNTAKKILEVDAGAVSDHGLVDAQETQQLLKEVLKTGRTKTEIAGRLGSIAEKPALQLKKDKVRAKSAQKVRKLHKEVLKEIEWEKRGKYICNRCGRSHKKEDRLEFLKRHLPNTSEAFKELWPCAYDGIAGDRALYRDLNDLFAEADHGTWRLRIGLK